MKKTKNTVLSATLAAASIVVQLFGSIFSAFDLTAAALSGMPLLVIRSELGLTYALLSYLTVSVLGVLLIPDKIIALAYILFFGLYPIFKRDFEKLGRFWGWVLKLLLFNLLFSGIIYVGKVLLSLADPLFAFAALPYIAANITFILYDTAMTMFCKLYEFKYKNKPYIKRLFGKN